VLGQSPRFTLLAWGSLFRIGCAGRDLFLDGGNLCLRLGDGRLKILQRQF